MHAQTRDEQTKRAVSTENVDKEGKQALTGDEEDLERLTSWRCGGRKNNEFRLGKFKIQHCHMMSEFQWTSTNCVQESI